MVPLIEYFYCSNGKHQQQLTSLQRSETIDVAVHHPGLDISYIWIPKRNWVQKAPDRDGMLEGAFLHGFESWSFLVIFTKILGLMFSNDERKLRLKF